MKPTGIIYLDGADGQGKTTLAEHFRDVYGAHILHCTYRWHDMKDGIMVYHFATLHRAAKLSRDRLVVIDRHWITEEIYAHVYRGGTKWPQYGRMIDRVMLKHGAITIICQSEPELGAARHRKMAESRVEMYKADDRMKQICQLFWDVYYGSPESGNGATYLEQLSRRYSDDEYSSEKGAGVRQDFFHYSIEDEGTNIPAFADVIIKTLQYRRERQYQPALDPSQENILGYLPTADVLFIGDQLNPKYRGLRWPFFDHSNSSLYLAQALHKIDFDETRAMYTNANGARDKHIRALLVQKPELRLVALGTKAAAALDYEGLDFYRVDHPQYARRFESGGNYHERLLKAVS